MKNLILFFSALALTFTASATSPTPLTFTTPDNNRLGLDLMQKSFEKNLREGQDGNIMTSPVSYYLALGMAYNGTAGQTREQMSELMGGLGEVESFNQQVTYFQSYLKREKRPKGDGWNDRQPPVVGLYNSAWHTTSTTPSGQGTFEFSQSYVDRMTEAFNAEVTGLDFKVTQSADTINAWAEEKTNGLIKNVIKADELRELIWVLMNATYLEANWAVPFEPLPTGDNEVNRFQTLDGEFINAEMISQDSYIPVIRKDNGDISVRLDFYDRGTDAGNTEEARDDLAFFIVMPKDVENFQQLRQNGEVWSSDFWTQTANKLSQEEAYSKTELIMPKFAFDYSVKMTKDDQITRELGLEFLYDDFANFSAMSTPDSVTSAVGFIKQDTRIELDEHGVKAAAVTTIGGIETTSIPVQSPIVRIDRPFYFAIASKNSGTLLFLGQVLNPTK